MLWMMIERQCQWDRNSIIVRTRSQLNIVGHNIQLSHKPFHTMFQILKR